VGIRFGGYAYPKGENDYCYDMFRKTLHTITALLIIALPVLSQVTTDTSLKKYKVAVFTPLYLDSAFDANGEYKQGKNFPKYINPGLEFYEGVQLALDSLQTEKVPLDIQIIDTRSVKQSLQQELSSPDLENTGLFIGHVTPAEARILAEAAFKRNIPFINANLPNDAGISNNSSYIILNATLKTHCEGLYRFLQKNYPTSPIIMFRKKGVLEDRLKGYFTEFEKTTNSVKLNIKYITLEESGPYNLAPYLDSNRLTVSIAGSMDENFGKIIAQKLATLNKDYPVVLVGMPTWDTINDFNRKEYKGLDIIYSTPFYNAKIDKVSNSINTYFNTNMYCRPSDMVFRGYECMYRFGKLLVSRGSNLSSSIGEKKFKVFSDFDIQPVINKQTMALDYFENKKLYFVRKSDGLVKQVY
jgi:hypothetical protein